MFGQVLFGIILPLGVLIAASACLRYDHRASAGTKSALAGGILAALIVLIDTIMMLLNSHSQGLLH